MRSAAVAEWMLSMVVERECARANVGDLLEENAGRAAVRFWMNFAGTWILLLGASFSCNWWRISVAAAGGAASSMMATLLFYLPLSVVSRGWNGFLLEVATQLWVVSITLYSGWWAARRAPGQELAACTLLILMHYVLSLKMALLHHGQLRAVFNVYAGAVDLLLLSTAVWVRLKRLRGAWAG